MKRSPTPPMAKLRARVWREVTRLEFGDPGVGGCVVVARCIGEDDRWAVFDERWTRSSKRIGSDLTKAQAIDVALRAAGELRAKAIERARDEVTRETYGECYSDRTRPCTKPGQCQRCGRIQGLAR